MDSVIGKFVLGSRSPRRRELLSHLLPGDQVVVVSPSSTAEAGFGDTVELAAIEGRLAEIARTKNDDVRSRIAPGWRGVLSADTVIVARDPGLGCVVLGQPPEQHWESVVREWFHRYYIGQTHLALTALCLATPQGPIEQTVVRTEVRFRSDAAEHLDWYLKTGESRGKAGGYALQGAGSLFVEQVTGSLSNVVGLPLRETAALLAPLLDQRPPVSRGSPA